MHCFVDTVVGVVVNSGVELVVVEAEVVCFEVVLVVLETGRFWVTVIGRFASPSAYDDEVRCTSTLRVHQILHKISSDRTVRVE
jgi:hypothetical protein